MCFRYLTVSLWCKSKTKFLVFQQYLPFFPYLCPWTFYKESERKHYDDIGIGHDDAGDGTAFLAGRGKEPETKEEILADFAEALCELKLAKEGKIKLRSVEDLLDEW